ncbi:MAG: sulfur carrier protein ThiS [Candidatus Korobacteraceae bacterium]
MKIKINGEQRELAKAFALSALIEEMGMKADRVAIERNGEIVPRSRWQETVVEDGDRLEVVHFVGGGAGSQLNQSSSQSTSPA